MPLTDEQTRALATRDVSIALSAGAGCGKTHVLTERFLSHLLPGANGEAPARLGQLIAITFTDAAAREMRVRIRNRCYELLNAAATTDEQHHWQRLLREIDAARISTIHAFCAALLRGHAAAANLDPTFTVLDQGEADLLQYEVVDDVLRAELEQLDEATLDLADAYGLTSLKEQLATLLGRRHDPAFHEWQDRTLDELVAAWQQFYDDHGFALAVRTIASDASLERMIGLLRRINTDGKKREFADARAVLLDLLPRIKEGAITHDELQHVRASARVSGLCSAKDWAPPEDYHAYKDACSELRALIDRHAPQPFDPAPARVAARLGLELLHLAGRVAREYDGRKNARGALDFDDLLAAAYKLIASPENAALRKQLADDVRLLLVDEFQDTDQLQADLVKLICGEAFDRGRLFFVGDFKQSIYRFRGAEPHVFHDLRATIKDAGRLPLTVNFRSQPAILHLVNALFCDIFSAPSQPYEKLQPQREQITAEPAVEFLWTIAPEKNNRRLAGAALEARRREARAIACRLRSLLDPDTTERPIFDRETKAPRPLRPGDVAILFRALSDVPVYEEALREHGLDYYLVGGHAFFAQQEIYDVLNLLRAIASTADEVSLAGALRSPFFALTDETLFWLAEPADSLNARLMADRLPTELAPEEAAKVAAAAYTIRHLRALKDRLPIARLLGIALDCTGYDAVLLAEFMGQRKLANLHKLLERARAADAAGVDLDSFITQLAQFVVRDPKEALAATLSEAADVIRLMTIHHAKGLEFPLVIVPDLDRAPNIRTPPAALHRQLGPLVAAPAHEDENRNIVTGMRLYAAAERSEELEERKRLLYVATTRAADYLILSSSLGDFDKPQSDWMKLLASRFNLQTGELLAALPNDYEAPRVLVTTEPTSDYKPAGRSRGPNLERLLDDAHELAARGEGIIPPEVAPIPADRAARRQFSISRLTDEKVLGTFSVTDDSSPSPFDDKVPGTLSATGFGTLIHDILAHIDFRSPADIAAWCEHLAPRHVLRNTAAACVQARELLERFVGSPHAKALAEAAAIHRELEFLLAWPVEKVSRIVSTETAANGSCTVEEVPDTFSIRGFIDCLYQDTAGQWHLLDYKTNNVTAADVPAAAQRYEMQLSLYAIAAERAMGQSPKSLTVHFLRPGKAHTFPWNAAARTRAIEMVNSAIAASTNAVGAC